MPAGVRLWEESGSKVSDWKRRQEMGNAGKAYGKGETSAIPDFILTKEVWIHT